MLLLISFIYVNYQFCVRAPNQMSPWIHNTIAIISNYALVNTIIMLGRLRALGVDFYVLTHPYLPDAGVSHTLSTARG